MRRAIIGALRGANATAVEPRESGVGVALIRSKWTDLQVEPDETRAEGHVRKVGRRLGGAGSDPVRQEAAVEKEDISGSDFDCHGVGREDGGGGGGQGRGCWGDELGRMRKRLRDGKEGVG